MAARNAAHLSLSTTAIELNTAAVSGGGVSLEDTSHIRTDPLSVIVCNNVAKAGGGMMATSREFVADEILAVVVNNTAHLDGDVRVWATNITVLGGADVVDFVSRPGAHEGLLQVKVVVSGQYGFPCEGDEVKAELDGRYHIATNISGKGGLTHFLLRVQQPPGFFNITFTTLDVPPAILSLHIRPCIKGEVTPSPDTCMVCPPGSYSLDPSQQTCQPCPEPGASCPGGDAIVPQPGWWHSARDSAQMHR
jgi:hypothetical protein